MLRPDTFALTGLLALLVAFGPVATDLYVPSMPEIGRLLGASPAEVQLTLSSYLVGFAFGQIIYGAISDRYGRKPVLLFALVLFCAASAACAAAPGIELLIAARILQALGGSGAIVLRAPSCGTVMRETAPDASCPRWEQSCRLPRCSLLDRQCRADQLWLAGQFHHRGECRLFRSLVVWQSLPETLHQRSARVISMVERRFCVITVCC